MSSLMPNFLIVGAAKGGTTSIYEYIKGHPDIFMSEEQKEPTFFPFAGLKRPVYANDKPVRFITDFEEYQNLFSEVRSEKIIGEASTPYLYLYDQTIQGIKKYVPDPENVKILIVLRNPVERAYSQYMMKVRDLIEPLSFQEALDSEEQRVNDGYHFDFFYKDRGLYFEQVKAYKDSFKDVKVLFFEDLKNNPSQVVAEVYSFLGVDTNHDSDFSKTYNFSGKPKFKFISALQRDRSKFRWLKDLFPTSFRNSLKHKLNKLNLERVSMSEAERESLKAFYYEDICKLENLLEVDLSHWK